MIIIFTDLDGTLLNAENYSYEPAREALKEISTLQIPLVMISSKTKKEIESVRRNLGNRHPFVSENGGGIFIPEGYFPFPVPYARRTGHYLVVESGISYACLTEFLDRIIREDALPIRGFHSLSVESISRLTGLSIDASSMAKEREYDEPFLFDGNEAQWNRLEKLVGSNGLALTRGGRFNHLSGPNDKGTATGILIDCYRHQHPDALIVGLGDAVNDLPFLRMVDYPVLMQRPDGTYESGIDIPELYHTPQPGPAGWNSAVLKIIRRYRSL
ncbi:MAG: HAD-IIB family hydrolase [Thermodesulfobacteriota bacterium]|nr:HAD-IIB family hydrolase [Thermodesulfobacteriota bacterium]